MSREREYQEREQQRRLDEDWERVERTRQQVDRYWQEELERERQRQRNVTNGHKPC